MGACTVRPPGPKVRRRPQSSSRRTLCSSPPMEVTPTAAGSAQVRHGGVEQLRREQGPGADETLAAENGIDEREISTLAFDRPRVSASVAGRPRRCRMLPGGDQSCRRPRDRAFEQAGGTRCWFPLTGRSAAHRASRWRRRGLVPSPPRVMTTAQSMSCSARAADMVSSGVAVRVASRAIDSSPSWSFNAPATMPCASSR